MNDDFFHLIETNLLVVHCRLCSKKILEKTEPLFVL